MRLSAFLIVFTFAAVPAFSHAAVILHDEGTDGDLPTVVATKNFGTLQPGSYVISGHLDGGTQTGGTPDGPDESDGFTFSTSEAWSLDVTQLVGTNGRLTIRPNVALNALVSDVQADFRLNVPAGSYSFNFAPDQNAGTLSYGFQINVIPEPATGILMVACAMTLLGRRRRQIA